jgi:hypothetical protein
MNVGLNTNSAIERVSVEIAKLCTFDSCGAIAVVDELLLLSGAFEK